MSRITTKHDNNNSQLLVQIMHTKPSVKCFTMRYFFFPPKYLPHKVRYYYSHPKTPETKRAIFQGYVAYLKCIKATLIAKAKSLSEEVIRKWDNYE